MNELISVVVPIYNIETYMRACVDSILAQTYPNIEIILVDDGSKDHSGEIADEYALRHPGKIEVIHQKNSGVMRARLNGIAASNGEWIGFVDSDDVIEPDMYQRLLENAHKYQADISHCGYQTIVNDGERIHYFYNTGRVVQQDRMKGLQDLLSGTYVEPGLWNKLFRRSLFDDWKDNELLPSGIRINEDLLMNYYLFKEAKLSIYEDFCPYHYMAHTSSATRSGFAAYKFLDPVKVQKIIYDDAESGVKEIALTRYIMTCMGAYHALYGKMEYHGKCEELKQILLKNKKNWKKLSKKDRIKITAILKVPIIYKAIYAYYEKFFQKKQYE